LLDLYLSGQPRVYYAEVVVRPFLVEGEAERIDRWKSWRRHSFRPHPSRVDVLFSARDVVAPVRRQVSRVSFRVYYGRQERAVVQGDDYVLTWRSRHHYWIRVRVWNCGCD